MSIYINGVLQEYVTANGVAMTQVTANGTLVYGITGSQTFTSSGTFVVPAGVTKIHVCMCGGGGGGAGDRGGGGGGSGAVSATLFPVNQGENISVTIGVGGAAGDNNGDYYDSELEADVRVPPTDGDPGTNSEVASSAGFIIAEGAPGGIATTNISPGSGGVGVNGGGTGGGVYGWQNGTGSSGCGGDYPGGVSTNGLHGGGGGGGGFGKGADSNALAGFGGGGSGGHAYGTFDATAGGGGKCIISWSSA